MKMNYNDIYDDLLIEFGDDYLIELKALLIENDKQASGNLINSLDYRIKDNIVEILSEDYLTYVDSGRKPGSFPPLNAISNWATIKNIPQTAVFPIARKIYQFGIEPTNVINNSVDNIFKNNRKYENILSKEVREKIIEQFKR